MSISSEIERIHRLQEVTYEEIAANLGLSIRTLRRVRAGQRPSSLFLSRLNSAYPETITAVMLALTGGGKRKRKGR